VQNHSIKIANRSCENVALFRYLGITVANQNLIWEEIKRLNSGNDLLPFSSESSVFLSGLKRYKNQNIQNYNCACGSVWASNLVSDIKGGT
jgi:hypothetical protein